MSEYLVIFYGRDTLGIQPWHTYKEAKIFADKMRENALTCQIYNGTMIDEALRDKQDKAMSEITLLDLEVEGGFKRGEFNSIVGRVKK